MRFIIAVGLRSHKLAVEPKYRVLNTDTGRCKWIGREDLIERLSKDSNYVENVKLNSYSQLVGIGFCIDTLAYCKRTRLFCVDCDRSKRLVLYVHEHDGKDDELYVSDAAGNIEHIAIEQFNRYRKEHNVLNGGATFKHLDRQCHSQHTLVYIN